MTQPIDSQNLFSKTIEVQKMQQNLQNQSTNQTDVFAEQLKKSTDEKEVKTNETEETIMQQGGDGISLKKSSEIFFNKIKESLIKY